MVFIRLKLYLFELWKVSMNYYRILLKRKPYCTLLHFCKVGPSIYILNTFVAGKTIGESHCIGVLSLGNYLCTVPRCSFIITKGLLYQLSSKFNYKGKGGRTKNIKHIFCIKAAGLLLSCFWARQTWLQFYRPRSLQLPGIYDFPFCPVVWLGVWHGGV